MFTLSEDNNKRPLVLSIIVHMSLVLILMLGAFFEGPKLMASATSSAENKPIIKAAVVDRKAVSDAIARQEQVEQKKQQQLANEKRQAEKLKQEVKKAKELADKLKADAEAAKLQAKQELAKASKIQEQIAQAKQQVEHEKKQAEQAKQQAAQARQQAEQEKKSLEETRLADAKAKAEAQAKATADQQAKVQAAESQLQAAKRQRWLDTEFNRFVAGLSDKIYNNRTLSSAFPEGLVCKIQLQIMPDGSVAMVKVISSSGNSAYDSMAEAAVYKSAPFEMPADKELVAKLRDIIFEFTDDYMS